MSLVYDDLDRPYAVYVLVPKCRITLVRPMQNPTDFILIKTVSNLEKPTSKETGRFGESPGDLLVRGGIRYLCDR